MAADHSVFVGDLSPEVSDYDLQSLFHSVYSSVRSAKVITDPASGRSKGYGFVRFGNELERDRSLVDMNGQILASRPIRVSLATAKKSITTLQGSGLAGSAPHPSDYDPNNTTLFIGGLSAGLSEEELRAYFAPFGDIVYTKIPPGKGCGFVQFVNRANAEVAMQSMQGQVLGQSSIRISWGRSSSNARPAASYGSQGSYPFPGATNLTAYGASPGGYGAGGYENGGSYGAGYGAGAAPAAGGSSDPYASYYAQIAAQDSSSYQALLAAYQQTQGGGQSGGLAQGLQGGALQPLPASGGLGSGFGGGALKGGGAGLQQFDPRAPANVADLNRLLVERHQSSLLGAYRHHIKQ